MEKHRILIVDDEKTHVELMEEILSCDYSISKAYDGNEALTKVEEISPDLILLDILMKGKSGYDVCRSIKNNNKTKSIPIVMLTSLKEKKDRLKAIQAGSDDFINKPIDMDILCARVESLLKNKLHYDSLLLNEIHPVSLTHSLDFSKNNPKYIENIVKNHLELIILKMLYQSPICGYDLLKEIYAKYNVILSQGTVYPMLHSMHKKGIVNIRFQNGNMRSKIYSVNQEGKRIIDKKINEFVNIENYILNTICSGIT